MASRLLLLFAPANRQYASVLAVLSAKLLPSSGVADQAVGIANQCLQIIELVFQDSLDEAEQLGFTLIGGQALSIWANFYLLDSMTGKEALMATSDDIDFCARDKGSINFLETRLKQTFRRPTMDDVTPHLAVAEVERNGHLITVDLLDGVAGVKASMLARSFLAISVLQPEIEVWVIDPVCCLYSRLHNLYAGFTADLDREKIRVDLAVRACKLYLCQAYEDDGFPAIRYSLKKIKSLARSQLGVRAYLDYGIDILRALPEPYRVGADTEYGKTFLQKTCLEVESKRSKQKNHRILRGIRYHDPENERAKDTR